MSSPDEILPQQRLRVMQIIATALLLGMVIFLAIVLFLVLVQNNGAGMAPAGNVPMISIVAVVLLVVQAPLAFLLPAFVTRSALRQIASGAWRSPAGADPADFSTDASKLLIVRQTMTILGLALLEGAALFACVAYLLEAQSFTLAAVLVALLLMLVNFPTAERVRTWLERQIDQLAELRQRGDVVGER